MAAKLASKPKCRAEGARPGGDCRDDQQRRREPRNIGRRGKGNDGDKGYRNHNRRGGADLTRRKGQSGHLRPMMRPASAFGPKSQERRRCRRGKRTGKHPGAPAQPLENLDQEMRHGRNCVSGDFRRKEQSVPRQLRVGNRQFIGLMSGKTFPAGIVD